MDSGTSDASDADELNRVENYDTGGNQNPNVTQSAPISRAVQRTEGPNGLAGPTGQNPGVIANGAGGDGYYHFNDPFTEFIANNPVYDPIIRFLKWANGNPASGSGGRGPGPGTAWSAGIGISGGLGFLGPVGAGAAAPAERARRCSGHERTDGGRVTDQRPDGARARAGGRG